MHTGTRIAGTTTSEATPGIAILPLNTMPSGAGSPEAPGTSAAPLGTAAPLKTRSAAISPRPNMQCSLSEVSRAAVEKTRSVTILWRKVLGERGAPCWEAPLYAMIVARFGGSWDRMSTLSSAHQYSHTSRLSRFPRESLSMQTTYLQ